ncbi:hypothetical protein [Flavobacterium sp. NRK F7]|uniref:hypothetical protein n=1 Tax=Flavobacterium sp. NRK F7 TaxID=2954930 RepID=UPI002091A1E7|nr:hypothetical protein [Flavobacterium sp. NRK F7]MCO6162991.1 hypothetical protein [Flavobacterium sp. NRK F7]
MDVNKQHFRFFFLLAVGILLLNDFFLKATFHNAITGKLSDVAGLFAFPYFISLVFPKKVKLNYVVSVLLFITWKWEGIEPLLQWFQSIGIGINRTVDYTDLYALAIVPLSYWYWFNPTKTIILLPKTTKPAIIYLCSFAFIATSLPKQYGIVHQSSNLEIQISQAKDSLIAKMELKEIDSIYYYTSLYLKDTDTEITYIVSLKENENKKISIKLDSIREYEVSGAILFGIDEDEIETMQKFQVKDYERLFLERKIIPLYK